MIARNSILLACLVLVALSMRAEAQPVSGGERAKDYLFNDSHFHLTNYVQKGTDIKKYLAIMGVISCLPM
jgi:hypothetical protein